jgi:acetoacetate decarboxylase
MVGIFQANCQWCRRGLFTECADDILLFYVADVRERAFAMPLTSPLEVYEPIVKYEFIRMPDSTGFGDYTETGQVIPVSFRGRKGSYSHCMFLNDDPPTAGGRELWGFPKKTR